MSKNETDVQSAGKGHPVPEKYQVFIDKEKFEVANPIVTGRELLTLAAKVPVTGYLLTERARGQVRAIELDEPVDLRTPGIEKFTTLARDCTEGEAKVPRVHFRLPEEDEAYLAISGLVWETVIENGVRRLLIHRFRIPGGYNHEQVDLFLRIEAAYPDTQIDMVYFSPALALRDNRAIGGLSHESFDGRDWQRWSRHRTPANPWRPGVDNVGTHLTLVRDWLAREVRRVAA